MSKIVPDEKARQGGIGRRLLLILIGGLALAFIAWAGVEIYGAMIAPPQADIQGTAPRQVDPQNTPPGG